MRREEFINLRQKPARLTNEEAGWLLNFSPEHIAILVRKGILRPLGHPPLNGVKFFHLPDVLELAADRRRMALACDALVNTWKEQNSARAKGKKTLSRTGREVKK